MVGYGTAFDEQHFIGSAIHHPLVLFNRGILAEAH